MVKVRTSSRLETSEYAAVQIGIRHYLMNKMAVKILLHAMVAPHHPYTTTGPPPNTLVELSILFSNRIWDRITLAHL